MRTLVIKLANESVELGLLLKEVATGRAIGPRLETCLRLERRTVLRNVDP
jgi:hypothetical protein